MKLFNGTPDLRDSFELRKNYPKIHNLSINDEILFLCTNPKPIYEAKSGYNQLNLPIPAGYEDTGCLVIPRKNRKAFRDFLFLTFEEFKYEISSIADFLDLKRAYSFEVNGTLLQSSDWLDKMHNYEYFSENDKRLILIPKSWALEIKYCRMIKARENAIENGKLKINLFDTKLTTKIFISLIQIKTYYLYF